MSDSWTPEELSPSMVAVLLLTSTALLSPLSPCRPSGSVSGLPSAFALTSISLWTLHAGQQQLQSVRVATSARERHSPLAHPMAHIQAPHTAAAAVGLPSSRRPTFFTARFHLLM